MQLRKPGLGWLVVLVLGINALGSHANAAELEFAATRASLNDATSDIVIAWEGGERDQQFDIYVSDRADAQLQAAIPIARAVPATSGTWRTSNFDHIRPYFTVTEAGSSTVLAKTAVRLLPLRGGRNFRDIGGYRTADGRVTKWGQVFRSGHMSTITDADYEFLSGTGIRVVCDFRSVVERKADPTN